MSGMKNFYPGTETTLCPHCDTRFKITEAQLEAHQGMVRCGHCLQAFDARPDYIPDEPNPQLELPMLDQPVADVSATACIDETAKHDGTLDYTGTIDVVQSYASPLFETKSPEPMTLAEQVLLVKDEEDEEYHSGPRIWPWTMAALLLLLVLLAQATYFFRVDLAARLPGLKPALISYCQLLKCTVPLPRNAALMSIESSNLDPANENQITLNALLRNRAAYSQAFPNLELTLNDMQDNAMARRVFRPADYLPPVESEELGLLPHHEISVRLHLDTTDLRPTGYRLVLLYPQP